MSLKITIRGTNNTDQPAMDLFLANSLNGIALRGRDNHGDEWNLLWVQCDSIQMADGIPESAGWPIDEHGRVIITNLKVG